MRPDGYLLSRRATLIAMDDEREVLEQQAEAEPGDDHRQQLADAIHPVFVIGVPLMAVTFLLVLLIPELPLRRTVREVPA